MKNNQKGFIVPVLISIIVLLVIGGGVYIYETRKAEITVPTNVQVQQSNQISQTTGQDSSVTPSHSDQPVTVANWKTYRNEKYGFEMQYPIKGYAVDERSRESAGFNSIVSVHVSPPPIEFGANFSVAVKSVGSAVNLQQSAKNLFGASFIDSESIKVNNITWLKVRTKDDYFGKEITANYFTQQGNNLYRIYFFPLDEDDFVKILASFKFFSVSSQNPNTGSNVSNKITVVGMQQYNDSNFGFSFYYPSSWTVQNVGIKNSYIGGSVQKSLTIGPEGAASGNAITIDEYYSPTREITIAKDLCSPMNGSSVPQHRFYFDTNLHTWMVEVPAYTGQSERDGSTYSVPASTKAADVSQNTMGGLHMLGAGCSGYVIPLSAQNFLVYTYYSRNVGSFYGNIAKTIVASDPSVATPVSVDEQIQTITNAGVLLDAIGKKVGEWHVTNEHVYNYLGNLIASANPSTFQLISKYSDGSLGVSYATDGAHIFSGWMHGQVVDDADPTTFVAIRQQYQIPYAQSSGRYGESFTSYDVSFSKDKSHVWYQSKLIPGADPVTFVVTGDTNVENSTGGYTLAHDARHTYGIDKSSRLTIDGVAIQ